MFHFRPPPPPPPLLFFVECPFPPPSGGFKFRVPERPVARRVTCCPSSLPPHPRHSYCMAVSACLDNRATMPEMTLISVSVQEFWTFFLTGAHRHVLPFFSSAHCPLVSPRFFLLEGAVIGPDWAMVVAGSLFAGDLCGFLFSCAFCDSPPPCGPFFYLAQITPLRRHHLFPPFPPVLSPSPGSPCFQRPPSEAAVVFWSAFFSALMRLSFCPPPPLPRPALRTPTSG